MPKQDYYEKGQLTDLVYLVLLTLVKPRHGYLIMNEIENLTEGNVKIGPASLYTTLKKLSDCNYIELTDNEDKKKTYQITEKGIDVLLAEIEKRKRLAEYGIKILNEYDLYKGGVSYETL